LASAEEHQFQEEAPNARTNAASVPLTMESSVEASKRLDSFLRACEPLAQEAGVRGIEVRGDAAGVEVVFRFEHSEDDAESGAISSTQVVQRSSTRLPDPPVLDDAISAPCDLPRPGVGRRVTPRHASSPRLPDVPWLEDEVS
jgi:hypothetical protein